MHHVRISLVLNKALWLGLQATSLGAMDAKSHEIRKANMAARFDFCSPFFRDLKTALVELVTLSMATHVPEWIDKTRTPKYYFDPPVQLKPSSCCCNDKRLPAPHTWQNCPNMFPVDMAFDSKNLKACNHGTAPLGGEKIAHRFCRGARDATLQFITATILFNDHGAQHVGVGQQHVASTALEMYYQFMVNEDPREGDHAGVRHHVSILTYIAEELICPQACRKSGNPGFRYEPFVHGVLDWRDLSYTACIGILTTRMKSAKQDRLEAQQRQARRTS